MSWINRKASQTFPLPRVEPRLLVDRPLAGDDVSLMRYPVTPDGRYFVVRGRLWRMSDPGLDPAERERLVRDLMSARRAVRDALRGSGDLTEARARVDAAKRALGERGPPWWRDGAPDYNRRPVGATPYAGWFTALPPEEPDPRTGPPRPNH